MALRSLGLPGHGIDFGLDYRDGFGDFFGHTGRKRESKPDVPCRWPRLGPLDEQVGLL
jgi:hypothetical protein